MALGGTFPWPTLIRPYSDPGLATCLGERRLCSGGSPRAVSALDVEALCLAEWAVEKGRVLALIPADPLSPVSALIAAAVHVADMAELYAATGTALGSSRRVAVVSSDYHVRGVYRGLGVRQPRSLSVAPLRDAVPPATLGRDGVLRVLGGEDDRVWSTAFVSSVADIGSLGPVDLAVVDLPAPGAEELVNGGTPVVLLARDPADPLLLRVGDRALVFGWGPDDVSRIRDDDDLPPRLACRAGGGRCEIVSVPGHAVCENAALFWQDVGALVRSGSRSVIARQLSREAFSLFHDLLGLALPIAAYEGLAGPMRVRLDAIGSAARLTHGETKDLYLPMVEAELRDLAAALGDVPPKELALMRTLRELLDGHGDVMLVTRTAPLARLYESRLSEDPRLARVRVTSLGALSEEQPAEVAVLTGMAPTWARWIYRAGVADSVRVLAYTPEGELESVANGFDEAELVRRVVADQRVRETWFARPAEKDRVWSELSGDPRTVPDDGEVLVPRGDVDEVSMMKLSPIEVPPGLWDGRDWLAPLEPGPADAAPEGGLMTTGGASVVTAVRVTFHGGRWALMDVAGTVTRFRPGSGSPDLGFVVSQLRPGDRVLFLDRDSRKDLLDKVLEVAGEVPALAVASSWLTHWRRGLAAAYRRFGSYPAFTAALHGYGCRVQPQTVRLWVVGVTIGPDDEEDVRRVGIAMNDGVLLDGHREVCRAMRSLRGAHVVLGRRLSEIARQIGPATLYGNVSGDEVVDERSGLTAADFQDSIDILTVESVEPVGDVPYMLVGRLNEPDKGQGEGENDA